MSISLDYLVTLEPELQQELLSALDDFILSATIEEYIKSNGFPTSDTLNDFLSDI